LYAGQRARLGPVGHGSESSFLQTIEWKSGGKFQTCFRRAAKARRLKSTWPRDHPAPDGLRPEPETRAEARSPASPATRGAARNLARTTRRLHRETPVLSHRIAAPNKNGLRRERRSPSGRMTGIASPRFRRTATR